MSDEALAKINQWREARALSEVTRGHIWLQMTHRIVAVLILLGIGAHWFWQRRVVGRLCDLWAILVLCQVTLGAWTIWSNKAADIATAHVAMGAALLSLGVAISALAWRTPAGQVARRERVLEAVHAR